MAPVHRIGFTELSDNKGPEHGSYQVKYGTPPRSHPATDISSIVFVHGLGGHPQTTWADKGGEEDEPGGKTGKRQALKALFTHKHSTSAAANSATNEGGRLSNKVFWPRDYLTVDVPEARVWTYGYNSDVIGMFKANNQNSVSQHGQDFAVKIERDIDNEDPIIFVAHSLVGIIVKDALHRSNAVRLRTKFIIFLGTPHRGSSSSGWGEIASNLATLVLQDSNKRIVKTLEVNGEVLDNIQSEFQRIVLDSRINVHSFQEAKGITGIKGLHGKVVDDFSSKVGLPPPFERIETLDANHMQMARCKGRGDLQYRAISAVLKQFMRGGNDIPAKAQVQDPLSVSGVEIDKETMMGQIEEDVNPAASGSHYYVPLGRNDRFVGRASVLNSLEEKLFTRKECQNLAIVGLGGVGKTQVALQFAYWVQKNHPEYSIFWVPTLSDSTFEQAYAEMAKQLGLQKTRNDDSIFELVQRHLGSGRAGKWLLVVDNADDYSLFSSSGGIGQHLPQSPDGLTIFTTRSRDVALALAAIHIIDLGEMNQQDARTLLTKSCVRKELLQDEFIIDELLDELAHLPLAISQAAAYINRNQLPVRKYLRLLRGAEQDVIRLISKEFQDSTRYSGSHNAVATTWIISFEQIKEADTTAAHLLSFMSCIEPKAIPQSIFPNPESEETEHALGTLCGYSFLTRRGDSDIFDMHSLVHMAIRIWVKRHTLAEQTTLEVINHLAGIFPSDFDLKLDVWRDYMPHTFRILDQTVSEYYTNNRVALLIFVARYLYRDRRYKEAAKYYEKVYEWGAKHSFENFHFIEQNLACAYLESRQLKEAIARFEHVLEVRRNMLDEEDYLPLRSEEELANAYLEDKRIKEAIALLEHVVSVRRRTLSEEDMLRLTSECTLASAYLEDKRVKKAIAMFESLVTAQERISKDDDIRFLTSQYELSRAYFMENRAKEAMGLLEQVASVTRRTLHKEHRFRLKVERALAQRYFYAGQVGRAVELIKYVVLVMERVFAEDDPDRIASESFLQYVYESTGAP